MLKPRKPGGVTFQLASARRIRIRYKILLGFAALILIFALFGAYVYLAIQTINNDVQDISQVFQRTVRFDVVNQDRVQNSISALEDFHQSLGDYVVGKTQSKNAFLKYSDQLDKRYKELQASVDQENRAAQNAGGEASAPLRADVVTMKNIQQAYELLQTHTAQTIALVDSGQGEKANQIYSQQIDGEINRLQAQLAGFQTYLERRTQSSLSQFGDLTGYIQRSVSSLEGVTLVTLLVTLLLSLAVSYVISEVIAKPIQQLQKAAAAVESETYSEENLAGLVKSHDELGQLARVFARMAREVRARAEGLRSQISALHIEIDEIKRKKQVAEVVESDGFQDLRAKAKALRSQREDEQLDPNTGSPSSTPTSL